MDINVNDKLWGFLSNLLNDCSLDIISPCTTFLHEWEVLEIIDKHRCFISDCRGMVNPRQALIRDLYKTKEDAIFSMKSRLDELLLEEF